MDLSNLTIIIPTYNRQSALKRLLKYLFKSNIKTNILILDASPSKIKKEILDSYSTRLSIEYKNYTSKEYIFSVPKRINNGLKYVITKYCLLHADDDFVFPSGLRQSIDFLEDNKDFVSCQGLSYHHYLKPYLSGKALSLYPGGKNQLSSDSNNPLSRVKNYIEGKTNNVPYYAVFKTETFKKIWIKTSQISLNISFGLEEIFPCALGLVYGKNKVLKIPFFSREPIFTLFFDHINVSNLRSLYSKEKLELSTHLLADELHKLYNLDLKNSKKIILKSLNNYVELHELKLSKSSKFFFKLRQNLRMILSNLIKYVPRKLGLIRPYINANLLESEYECIVTTLQSHSQSTIVSQIKKSRNSYFKSY